jgi:hypothetical protein
MKRVYVAGPISKGDVGANVHLAIVAGDRLLAAGYAPYVPHLSFYWHIHTPHDYEVWMALDFAYLAVCDALVRLPGESPGADREVAFAKEHGITVYDGLDELLWSQDWEGEVL